MPMLACLPERFDGTHGPIAQAFLQQTSLYFLAHPDQFSDEATPPNGTNRSTSGFNSHFLKPESKGKAQQALRSFKQSGNV
ncbi:hypothetical protein VP01_519g4 [Puccinia sorghi]|uniref:Uncharacterized protein n=1 Tax=Puccinia sorghi TaxID=27349 RepID=A0A0L6UMQ2_9BASI|nr:hypothetical protein VP01_519g4 [Puccinia sorghi]